MDTPAGRGRDRRTGRRDEARAARGLRLTLLTILTLGALGARPCPSPAAEPAPAASPAEPIADLAPDLAAAIEASNAPAMGAIVVRSGGVIARGVAGVRARGQEPKVTLDDRWHIGSMTKSMTSTLIARLVDRGVLRWEQTLAESFPGDKDAMHEAFRNVTLAQLCSHRAGLVGDVPPLLWARLLGHKGTPTQGREITLRELTSKPPKGTPGEHFEYSNFGYMIAGLVAERATGKAWEDLIREEVFAPLGMDHAGVGPPGSAGEIDNARGHDGRRQPITPGPHADNPPSLGPAGTVHATLGDLAAYVRMHLRGHRGERTDYLPTAAFVALHTPAKGDYARGWVQRTYPWAGSAKVFWHNGSNTMWYSEMAVVPDWDLAIVVTCNDANARSRTRVGEVLGALAQRFGKPQEASRPVSGDPMPGAK